jgi:hypothetical protein
MNPDRSNSRSSLIIDTKKLLEAILERFAFRFGTLDLSITAKVTDVTANLYARPTAAA